MRLPLLSAIFASALSLSAASCGEEEGESGLTFDVMEEGPFRAGFRTLPIEYVPEGESEPRAIELSIWYPTNDVHREGETSSPRYAGLFRDLETIVDASLARSAYGARHPVVVHSHGHRGFPGNSYRLVSALARHGFVVVAPEHIGDTLTQASEPFRSYLYRAPDASAALDALAALPSRDPLAGKVELDRVILTGHSRGSFTVFAALGGIFDVEAIRARCDEGGFGEEGCSEQDVERFGPGFRDPRIVAAISMAGTGDRFFFGEDGQNAIEGPLLLMTGSLDDVGAEALFEDLGGHDVAWVDIEGGCHQLYGLGGCSEIDDETGQPIVRTYALSFIRRHLFDDEDETVRAILAGELGVSPLATFRR